MIKKILTIFGIELLSAWLFRYLGIVIGFIIRFILDPKIEKLSSESFLSGRPIPEVQRLQNISLFFSSNFYLFLWTLLGILVGLYFVNKYWKKIKKITRT
jgi:hypothetical protein